MLRKYLRQTLFDYFERACAASDGRQALARGLEGLLPQGNRVLAKWFDYCVGSREGRASIRGLGEFSLARKEVEPMSAAFVSRIGKHFEEVTDPRVNRGTNFPLIEMVFVALCGAICDCNSWVDVASFGKCKLSWFRRFLPFDNGVPAHDTFTELFARLDTLQFYAALESWAWDIHHQDTALN